MEKTNQSNLPQIAVEHIDSIIKHMKYRKKVRAEVREELTAHFTDALADCQKAEEKKQVTEELVTEFGDVKMLGKLMRRAKKRCRPVWQQIIFAVLKIVGIIFLLLLLRMGYMATGRPTISVDYTQWMNDKVRDGRDESLNAWHNYQKAISLIPKEYPPKIQEIDSYTREQVKTPEDWAAIEAFLKIHTEAFNEFRSGAAKPYYWNIYQRPKDHKGQLAAGVLENLMPQLGPIRKLAYRMMYFQIPFDIHKGHARQAFDDSVALYHFAHHLSSQGVVIEQLVGIAIESAAISSVYDLLSQVQVDLSAEDLLLLQRLAEKNYTPDLAPMDWSLEKAFWYDEIQRSFTDDGRGNGRPLLRGILFSVSDRADYLTGFFTGFPDRKEAVANIEGAYNRFGEYRSLKPKTLNEMEAQDLLQVDNLMFMQQISEPAVKKTIEIGWRVRTSQAGLIGTLAILRFEKENNRLPDDWEELFESGYLKTIPMDPYSDNPLVYRKTDGDFVLYSVGLNFTDDGGVTGKSKSGNEIQWAENGDAVFWPVESVDGPQ